MIASSISAIILASLCMALTSVWREAAKTNEEMQVMLKASAKREALLVGTVRAEGREFRGLLNITNKVSHSSDGKRLEVDGPGGEDQSLPGRYMSGTNSYFTFGQKMANDAGGVSVTNISTSAGTCHRAKVRLWIETEVKGKKSSCCLPVAVTVVEPSQEGKK